MKSFALCLRLSLLIILMCCFFSSTNTLAQYVPDQQTRQRISLNEGWYFFKYDSLSLADKLVYDVRPEIAENNELRVADAKPTEAIRAESSQHVLKR